MAKSGYAYDEVVRDSRGRMVAHPVAVKMAFDAANGEWDSDREAEERHDREHEGAVDAGDVLDFLRLAATKLDPQEQETLLDGLQEIVNSGSLSDWAADTRRRRADDRRHRGSDKRRRARDEPEPFEGRPRPGGAMDSLMRRRIAADSAGRHSGFARRFPGAARIRNV
jgi:hypothetical protein